MLLTLTASCVAPLLKPKDGSKGLALLDLPAVARDQLGFGGLNLSTDLLVGADRDVLEGIRERADKAGCACLLLIEPEPVALADPRVSEAGIARLRRVVQAAGYLGCNSMALSVSAEDRDSNIVLVAAALRQVSEPAERLDVSVLVRPGTGLTREPERLTEIIKKVGGFRIGTFPEFLAASKSKDPTVYLRRLAPYAHAVSATTQKFTGDPPTHANYDLAPLVQAVVSVGYDGSMAVDYRGDGDVTLGVVRSREAIDACLRVLEQKPRPVGDAE